jgi:hypothetical protein
VTVQAGRAQLLFILKSFRKIRPNVKELLLKNHYIDCRLFSQSEV